MESLDLLSHEPEEFEGKLVTVNDCNYIIGKYLGMGQSKIVHTLRNMKSGLCHHVIKIWRDPSEAQKWRSGDIDERFARTSVPTKIQAQGHGGYFELEDYIGLYEEDSSETFKIMTEADKLSKQKQCSERIFLYQKALEINPYHTAALMNLAFAYGRLDDYKSAIINMAKAINIEPNYLPFYQNYIRYAAHSYGTIRVGIYCFEQMKARFPYKRDDDNLGAELYINAGRPEDAEKLLNEKQKIVSDILTRASPSSLKNTPFDPEELDKLIQITQDETRARNKALIMMNNARNVLIAGNADESLDLLQKAYTVYSRDTLLNLNLGLALQRAGKYKEAQDILLFVADLIDPVFIRYCLANASFCAIQSGNYSLGINILNSLAELLFEYEGIKNLKWDTLPSIAEWVDKESIREKFLDLASTLITMAIENYPPAEELPPFVELLNKLYINGVSEFNSLQSK